jgi:hypothetical protein
MQGAIKYISAALGLVAGTASLVPLPASAQESDAVTAEESREIEALEPGVDTSNAETSPEASVPAGEPEAGNGATEPGAATEVERVESGGRVMDRMELGRTEITGNQELPKVLYIVPWQDPSGIPSIELDPNFTEHEVFRRLYPPAYQRELKYYDLLKASEGKE